MISKYRKLFNAQFTDKKYQEFKEDIASILAMNLLFG
jgi:hypothetical protein